MVTYSYRVINGHVVFDVDEKIIVLDTGASYSAGEGNFSFNGADVKLQNRFVGLTTGSLSKFIGFPITVLMGCDIVGAKDLFIDAENKTLTFSDNIVLDGLNLPIDATRNIPIFKITVNNKMVYACFDTGAKLSYISRNITDHLEPQGQKADFYPSTGRFLTKTYNLKTEISGESVILEYGVLPEHIQREAIMKGVNCIIGTEILNHFNCVLSFRKKKLLLKRFSKEPLLERVNRLKPVGRYTLWL